MPKPDQRRQPRSPIHTAVEVVDIESGVDFHAESIDVSSNGLSFHAPMEPAMGAEMEVTLPTQGTRPARFTVLRIDVRGSGFDVSGSLEPLRA